MNIYKYILILDVFLWIIVPIRQIKKKYFFYFLFVVSADFFSLDLRLMFHSESNFLYIPFSFLSFVAILNRDFAKKYWSFLFVFLVLIFVANLYVTLNEYYILLCIIQLLIIMKLLKDFTTQFLNENSLNILFFDVSASGLSAQEVSERLAAKEVLAHGTSPTSIRMVTHHDVDRSGCERALRVLREVLEVAQKSSRA